MTKSDQFHMVQLTQIAFMAAVACILGPYAIQVPFSPVPFSLTNLVLYVFVYVLGWKQAVAGCLLYLLLGAVGLPVFSGFGGGLAKLAGPTGGYLVGFLFLTAFSGLAVEQFPENRPVHVAGMALGTAAAYLFGTLWLGRQLQISFTQALAMGVLPYLPWDSIKIGVAVTMGPVIRRRLRKAGA